MHRWIDPRRSFGRLILYVMISLLLVFIFSFLFVLMISKLFPATKG
jgi:hypothetical protein